MYYRMYFFSLTIESVLPSILALVVGRWSDMHGRKWPLVISAIGMALCYTGYLILTYFPVFCSQNLWLLLLPSIPVAFGGNVPVFMMASFAYIGDYIIINNSSNREKLWRYLICEACCAFGAPIGVYLGGIFFKRYGNSSVFAIAAFIESLAAMYAVLRIQNSSVKKAIASSLSRNRKELCNENEDSMEYPRQNYLRQIKIFLKRTFYACFRPREGALRTMVILMVICQVIATANYNLGSAIDYIYIRYKLNWSLQLFTEWKASYIAVAAFGGVFIAPWLQSCLPEHLQAALAFLLCGTFTFILGYISVHQEWLLWAALALPVLFLVPTSIARAVITRIVTVDEIGTVFGLISCIGGLTPMIMSTVGSSIFKYAVSMSINSGIVYFFATFLHFVGFSLSMFSDILWQNNKMFAQ